MIRRRRTWWPQGRPSWRVVGRGARQCVHAHRAGAVRSGCRGVPCPISRWRSCCCRSGSPSTSTRFRTGRARLMVPLFVLCTKKPLARNPHGLDIQELFTVPPWEERHYFARRGFANRFFMALDRMGRAIDPLIPRAMRARAMRKAENWVLARLNGEGGLGAIFPAMVNALEGSGADGRFCQRFPRRLTAKRAIDKLLVVGPREAYCQPCVSPVWDSALAALAMQEAGDDQAHAAAERAPGLAGPRTVARQSAGLAGAKTRSRRAAAGRSSSPIATTRIWMTPQLSPGPCTRRAKRRFTRPTLAVRLDWLVGLQSRNGGFAAFDADTPITSSMKSRSPTMVRCWIHPPAMWTARVVMLLAKVGRPARCDGLCSAQSPICGWSRSRLAPGLAAGAPTTSTAPGRC